MLPTNLVMVAPSLLDDPTRSLDNLAVRHGAGVAPSADRPTPNPRNANPAAAVQSLLQQSIGSQSYQLWFRDKTALVVCHDELIVQVASPFLLTWLQRQFRECLGSIANSVLGPAARVRFEVDGTLNVARTSSTDVVSQTSLLPGADAPPGGKFAETQMQAAETARPKPESACTTSAAKPSAASRRQPNLDAVPASGSANGASRHFAELADFVSGPCNQLAVTAARQVCEAPGQRLNPLYLFGGVGLGKTHLLEGMYCELRRRFPRANIVFLTSEQFANYFTQALRTHTLPSFRQRFRSVDVLLVDDVDFLDGKRAIQEEFLHTVKTLERLGKQLIVTSDRHPRLLPQTSEELSTRFVSGLVCRLEAPDLDTRTRLVQHKLRQRTLELTPDAAALVAQWFRNNVRELEGALNCLEAHFGLSRQRLTAVDARRILADLQRDCVRIVRLADIERVVCDLFRLIPEQLRSNSRVRHVAQPRMLAMFLARKLTQAAYSEIGDYFGGRNHSTVISAERQVQSWLAAETRFTIAAREWSAGELLQTLEQQLLAS